MKFAALFLDIYSNLSHTCIHDAFTLFCKITTWPNYCNVPAELWKRCSFERLTLSKCSCALLLMIRLDGIVCSNLAFRAQNCRLRWRTLNILELLSVMPLPKCPSFKKVFKLIKKGLYQFAFPSYITNNFSHKKCTTNLLHLFVNTLLNLFHPYHAVFMSKPVFNNAESVLYGTYCSISKT